MFRYEKKIDMVTPLNIKKKMVDENKKNCIRILKLINEN